MLHLRYETAQSERLVASAYVLRLRQAGSGQKGQSLRALRLMRPSPKRQHWTPDRQSQIGCTKGAASASGSACLKASAARMSHVWRSVHGPASHGSRHKQFQWQLLPPPLLQSMAGADTAREQPRSLMETDLGRGRKASAVLRLVWHPSTRQASIAGPSHHSVSAYQEQRPVKSHPALPALSQDDRDGHEGGRDRWRREADPGLFRHGAAVQAASHASLAGADRA